MVILAFYSGLDLRTLRALGIPILAMMLL
jgi:hypothetical protein